MQRRTHKSFFSGQQMFSNRTAPSPAHYVCRAQEAQTDTQGFPWFGKEMRPLSCFSPALSLSFGSSWPEFQWTKAREEMTGGIDVVEKCHAAGERYFFLTSRSYQRVWDYHMKFIDVKVESFVPSGLT